MRRLWIMPASRWFVTVVALGCIACVVEAEDGASQPKAPLPTADAQQQAAKLVAQLFGPQIDSAKASEQKLQLARQLLEVGVQTSDDPAGRYLLLTRASDLALDAGDPDLACQAARALEETFEVAPMSLQVATLSKYGKSSAVANDPQPLLARWQGLMHEAVASDLYDVAKTANAALQAAALQAKLSDTAFQAGLLNKQLLELEAEFAKIKPAMATLSAKADDPTANLQVGRYQGLVKGDWEKALPLLANSSDPKLKALAEQELQDEPDPLTLGDAWWTLSLAEQPAAMNRIQAHAAEWYRKAQSLTDEAKTRVDSRLATFREHKVPGRAALSSISSSPSVVRPATPSATPQAPLPPAKNPVARKLRIEHAPDATRIGNHFYKYIAEAKTWTEARDACKKIGGHLACFESTDERKEVADLNRKVGIAWIGGILNSQNSPVWVTGRPVGAKMKPKEKDQRYLALTGMGRYQLRPLSGVMPDTNVQGFICEWED